MVLGGMLLTTLSACEKEEAQPLVSLGISIEHKVGEDALILGEPLLTPLGEPLRLQVVKYYLSNFSVVYSDGSERKIDDTYFLVDQANVGSRNFSLQIPAGNVQSLKFWIGVDSARNVSGVQTGALDPVYGMFWTWNSGYIFAKLEGRSTVSPAPLQAVTYHIGGFRTGQNALRQVTIPFGSALPASGSNNFIVYLNADVLKWFRGATDVSIATDPATMEPGPLAVRIANNYAQMFTLKEVKVQ